MRILSKIQNSWHSLFDVNENTAGLKEEFILAILALLCLFLFFFLSLEDAKQEFRANAIPQNMRENYQSTAHQDIFIQWQDNLMKHSS